MSKHTPGPWKVNKDYKGRTIIDCNDDNICIMDSLHEVDIKHNARLIAAAPEMLEALKRCIVDAKQNLTKAERLERIKIAQGLIDRIEKD